MFGSVVSHQGLGDDLFAGLDPFVAQFGQRQWENHLQVGILFAGELAEFLHSSLLVDLVSFPHSDSLLFFLAEKTTSVIMTGVESRYFLRINGHPRSTLRRLPDP